MNRGKKLGNNVILMTIGNIGSKILTFLLVPLYTSCLSSNDYGISDLILTTVSFLLPIFSIQISEALLRFALDKEIDDKQVFSIGLRINIIGTFFLLMASPFILLIPLLKDYYLYFIAYYITYCIYVSISNFTCGLGKVKLYTIIGVFQTSTLLIGNILALMIFKLGIRGFLFSYILSYGLSSLGLLLFGKEYKLFLPNKRVDKNIQRKMIEYSLPMIPNSVSWWISNSSDKYILTAICGTTVMGIYSVAYKIPTILSVFYSVFMSAWRISSVDDFGSEDTKLFYSNVYKKIEAGLFVIAALIMLFNKVLSKILYANEFFEARFFVPILVIAFLLHGLGEFFVSVYTASKKTNMLFYSSLSGAIVNIILNCLMIPFMAGFGAALATLISYGVVLIIRIRHTKTIMDFHINFLNSSIGLMLLIGICIAQTIEIKGSTIYSFIMVTILIVFERKEIEEVVSNFLKGL